MSISTSGNVGAPREVTEMEVRQFADAIGLGGAAPERTSGVFRFQVYCHAVALHRDPSKIVAEVRGLEGIGKPVGTKPAAQFKHAPMEGFWKKHHLTDGLHSLAKNVQLEFGPKQRKLRQIIKEKFNPGTAHLSFESISRNLADAVVNLYSERARKQGLTGQWIVFGKHEGRNYYLCLAEHDETNLEIFERINRGCSAEFPFLFQGDT